MRSNPFYLLFRTLFSYSFFFNATAPTEIYTLSLHDALPILWDDSAQPVHRAALKDGDQNLPAAASIRLSQRPSQKRWRSEEHTSELQSLRHLVCRLLLEKKKKKTKKKKTKYKKKQKTQRHKR